MPRNILLENRRKRLQKAFYDLPYKANLVTLSKEQKLVEEIIVRLGSVNNDETPVASTSEASLNPKSTELIPLTDILDRYRPRKSVNAELSTQIENVEKAECDKEFASNLSINTPSVETKLDVLGNVATKMCSTRRKMQGEFSHDGDKLEMKLDDKEREMLMTVTIDDMIAAQLKLVQRWEIIKREASRLLAIEMDKLQIMEDELLEVETNYNINELFDKFRDSPGLVLNTSTPKSSGLEEEEESSESNESEISTKNRKKTYHLKTVPSSKYVRIDSPVEPLPSGDGFKVDEDGDSEMITIGPNGTQIKRVEYNRLNWSQRAPAITRKVLCSVFDRKTLTFNTLTGKPSPAFVHCGKPAKGQLDPLKIADIVHLVMSKVETTQREVRTAITTKCADENKLYRNSRRKSRKTV